MDRLQSYMAIPTETLGRLDDEMNDIMTSIPTAAEDSIPRFEPKRKRGN